MTPFLLYREYNKYINVKLMNNETGDRMLNSNIRVVESKKEFGARHSVTYYLICIIVGFVTSVTNIVGMPATINVAICAGLSFSGGICLLAGSLFSYLITGSVSFAIAQICTMLTILAIKFVGTEILNHKNSAVSSALVSGIFYIFYATGFLLAKDFSIIKELIVVVQGLIAGSATYFIVTVVKYLKDKKALPVTGLAGASLGVVYVLLISSLTSIDIWQLNIGRIVGVFIMLLAIRKYKYIGGAVAGVLASCGVILCSTNMGKTTMLLACAGLIAGLFHKFGNVSVVIAFIVSNFTGLLALGITGDTFAMMFDVAIATVIYIVIPSYYINQLFETIGVTKFSGMAVAENAGQRLDFASKTIQNVNLSLKEVSSAMELKAKNHDFTYKVCEKLCKNCPENLKCWQEKYRQTINDFHKLEKIIQTQNNIPDEFFIENLKYCTNKNNLKDTAYECFYEYESEIKESKRLREMRTLLSDQFYAMEEMLSSLSKQLSNYSKSDQELSNKVANYFINRGITNPKVCVYKNAYDYMEIEAFIPQNINFNDKTICKDLSDILEADLELPHYYEVGGLTRVEIWEKPEYSVEIGACQICGSSGEMTGDSYETFFDNQAQAFIVLSDGMGSGKRAQLDSLLASSLISRLLRAGVGYASAIRLVNSSMRVKSWEESFATVDIAIINLYNATLNIVKAGGSATYIIRGDELKKIETSSLPIGILTGILPEKTTHKLKNGDIIITASDGLVEESLTVLKQVAIANKHLNAKTMSEKIINAVKSTIKNKRTDDITIIVSKFHNCYFG